MVCAQSRLTTWPRQERSHIYQESRRQSASELRENANERDEDDEPPIHHEARVRPLGGEVAEEMRGGGSSLHARLQRRVQTLA